MAGFETNESYGFHALTNEEISGVYPNAENHTFLMTTIINDKIENVAENFRPICIEIIRLLLKIDNVNDRRHIIINTFFNTRQTEYNVRLLVDCMMSILLYDNEFKKNYYNNNTNLNDITTLQLLPDDNTDADENKIFNQIRNMLNLYYKKKLDDENNTIVTSTNQLTKAGKSTRKKRVKKQYKKSKRIN